MVTSAGMAGATVRSASFVPPLISQSTVVPLSLRQTMSEWPSPLKSPIICTCQSVGIESQVDVEKLRRAVHFPQHRGAVGIAPDDVRPAVAVIIADPLHVPVGGNRGEVEIEELLAAVHLPQHREA